MTSGYLARRLLQVVPTVAGIVIIAFLLVHIAPGDPVLALAGEHGDQAYYAFIRERFGLDRPIHRRLLTYAQRVLAGDLGVSYVRGRPVLAVILDRLPATLLLTGTALGLSTIVGIGLGLAAASRAGSRRDLAITATTLGAHAAPVFWLGQLAILVFAFRAGWFPVQGMRSAGLATGAADVAWHLALPALVLASQGVAAVARLTRSAVVEELQRDHVRTARAKGASPARVLFRHALPGALPPVVTVLGGRIGHLLAGAVIVEVVFAWPGIGRLMLSSLQARDVPVLMGLFLVVALTVALANLLTDLAYVALDPRVRHR